jgi:hypothetical protein
MSMKGVCKLGAMRILVMDAGTTGSVPHAVSDIGLLVWAWVDGLLVPVSKPPYGIAWRC